MAYIKSHLSNDEKVIYTTKIHWFIFVNPLLIISTIFSFIFLFNINIDALVKFNTAEFSGLSIYSYVFTIFYFIMVSLEYFTTEINLTNKRLFIKKGLFVINTTEMYYKKIESIDLEQTIIDNVINRGNVALKGTGDSYLKLISILNPNKLKSEISNFL